MTASYVVQNIKTKAIEKTPLNFLNCDELQTDLTGINYKKSPLIDHEECIEFREPTLIGEDPKEGIKKSIWFEVFPCLENCYVHNFGAFGMREIKPSNQPWYSALMHPFLTGYLQFIAFVNTVADFSNYDNPIKLGMGHPNEL